MSAAARPAVRDARAAGAGPVLGLRENWRQFVLLVLVNAFVGGMVGLERTVMPVIASREFGIASASAALSFIATFGITKAITNLAAGWLVESRGRRWTLIVGWLVALPVPLVILFAPSWSWIVAANALLGVSQGLTWSTAVIMKIDLVGPKRRGLAMGLNEGAGYIALAGAALASGFVASRAGLRAGPAYLGIAVAMTGLLLSFLFVRETAAHARVEAERSGQALHPPSAQAIRKILGGSLWRDASLFSVSQAGLVNNLNDGLAWGLFPLLFLGSGLSVQDTSILAAVYPATWGVCQVGTGALSDRWGRKWLIVSGMLLQGIALASMTVWQGFAPWMIALIALGVGTALVYPVLLAAVGDISGPSTRGATVGVYRLWRDLGYAAGALLAGLLADTIGTPGAINAIAVLTVASGCVVIVRLTETRRVEHPPAAAITPPRSATP